MNDIKLLLWIKNILIVDCIYKFKLKNCHNIPKIKKINLFVNLNHSVNTSKQIIFVINLLTLLTNQKPNILRSKKNVSGSKLRKGSILGCNVNISKKNVYSFLNFFIFFILPQIKNIKPIFLDKKNYSIEINNFLIIFSFFNKGLNFNEYNKIKLVIQTNLKNLEINKTFLSGLQIPSK